MCGIFGYIGKRDDAPQMVLQGLKKLEYRGYDSWGIASSVGGKITIEKHIGKIGSASINLRPSSLAIGHTRWATHGGVTVANAHPHLDCTHTIALLHNGIVENYAEIKKTLISKKHLFTSETDTEVIVHLIEENRKENDFVTSVKEAFQRLQGLNAIVVIDTQSEEIIACKNGSPLAVGKGENEYFVASDPAGIISYTKDVLFLKDQEMVVLGRKLSLYSLDSNIEINPQFEHLNWKIEESTMGKFDHFMIKEIYDQEKIIRTMSKLDLKEIDLIADVIKKARGTFFIGAGTAYYASLAGSYLFSRLAKRHVNTSVASEFNYLEDFLTDRSLIIAFSQSGETIDVIEPLQRAQKNGTAIIGIVNNLGSTIYRMADHKLLLGAGPEMAVASTKAYTSKLAMLLLLVSSITGRKAEIKKELEDTAQEIKRLLSPDNRKKLQKLAQELSHVDHIYTIGRGVSYPSALEAALKIKEVSYIHAEGLAGGELKHGTIALIAKGTPCIVFAPKDETYDAIISNATEIKARGGKIIGISPVNNAIFDKFIQVSDTKNGSIISQIIPIQLLAYYLALSRKLDPDKPRNLAKSVTVK